jgi:hypothetical protein
MKIELPAYGIKDQFPTINANYAPDSLKVDKSLFWDKLQMIMDFIDYPKRVSCQSGTFLRFCVDAFP